RVLPAGGRYLISAGSVGQPRDGDNRAKYLLWEPAPRRLTVRFVPYDVQDAARRFREAGVNERYVLRLL
ncbi:metallophosphoesterase, partial [Desulfovibrio sp. XJ01]|nr:metallophosphoesterase [Nitratidesulfovibrio liaohensis]